MNRKEFLEILRSQLAGQMQEGKAAAPYSATNIA